METITITCVGMGYEDKHHAVARFWDDYLGDVDVRPGLFLAFDPDNPHDPNAVAVVYYREWLDADPPTVQEVWTSEVWACGLGQHVIGYITKDDIPAFNDFFASLVDNDWETAAIGFEIDEIRTKNDFPTWMILTVNIYD